jgi:hypothetical protein
MNVQSTKRRGACPLHLVETLENRLTPAPVVLQPDLSLAKIGTATDGPPAQFDFGPDGRLYVTLANFGSSNAPSVDSFAYDPAGSLSAPRVEASTGGALGIGFGPVSLGIYGQPGVVTTIGMYLTDTARNGVSNLRVLTRDQNGIWGGPAGGTDTIIVQNIPAGWHQTDQIIVQQNSDGTSSLYVGIGVRTKDGALPYPNPGSPRDMAYGGTISVIKDLKQVNGLVTDSAGFGLTGVANSNNDPDYSNAGPYTSTAVNKLVVQSSGTRNPYGLALDGAGHLWFTNNYNRSQSDNTFNGTIDPSTKLMRGFTTGDPQIPGDTSDPDLKNNVYDQLFEAAPLADYGYNNSNWRNDAANDNPSVTSNAAVNAGFFNYAEHGVRSTTFDNLTAPPGGFTEYDESDINHIRGLGPSASADGIAFYTGNAFVASYRGDAFITRWSSSISDSTGHTITYADLVAVDPTTGNVRLIANQFIHPLAVLEDGHGQMLIADYGDGSIYRLTAAGSLRVVNFPSPTTAGVTQTFTVTAADVNGNVMPGYTGTVHFTSSDPNSAVRLPKDYTFTSADQGVHTFHATLVTAGTQSITATDTVTSTITGSQTGILITPAAVTHFRVYGFPNLTTAGATQAFTVAAKDIYGNIVTGYKGTVHFGTSDPNSAVRLPANYTFTAADHGLRSLFHATLVTAGTQSITATDTGNSSITGSQTGIVVAPAALHHFRVYGFPSPTTAGVAHRFGVQAKDLYGNTITSYTGTVAFSSSDSLAVLPGSYTFTAADAGAHTFTATLNTVGTQFIRVTDQADASKTGRQSNITVNAAGTTAPLALLPLHDGSQTRWASRSTPWPVSLGALRRRLTDALFGDSSGAFGT